MGKFWECKEETRAVKGVGLCGVRGLNLEIYFLWINKGVINDLY